MVIGLRDDTDITAGTGGDKASEVEVMPVKRATIVVSWGWASDALRGIETEFERSKVSVEMEIRGDRILDCNGQAVDANGNGTPGGTNLSYFALGEKPPYPDPDKAYATSTDNGGTPS